MNVLKIFQNLLPLKYREVVEGLILCFLGDWCVVFENPFADVL